MKRFTSVLPPNYYEKAEMPIIGGLLKAKLQQISVALTLADTRARQITWNSIMVPKNQCYEKRNRITLQNGQWIVEMDGEIM